MMALSTIREMSRERAAEAANENMEPFIVEAEDLDDMPPFPFPNIGDYRPAGWTLVETIFVDKSGMGRRNEPAMNTEQLLARLKIGMGYAIIEEGQFQLYLGEFEQEETPPVTPWQRACARLEYLRQELRAERISFRELAELQSLVAFMDSGDLELLEAAGVPEA
jgi:hypothetical protein